MGTLFIDGIDITQRYGVELLKGSYKSVFQYPELKPVETNNWWEDDGLEADLSNPVLDTQKIVLNFACKGDKLDDFFDMLRNNVYHIFSFREFITSVQYLSGRPPRYYYFQLTLRLDGESGRKAVQDLSSFSLTFYNDDSSAIDGGLVENNLPETNFILDQHDLNIYGIQVLKGARIEVETQSSIKKNLLIDINSQSGIIYDGNGGVKQEARTLKLPLYMIYNLGGTTTTPAAGYFISQWQQFIFDLVQPGARTLDTPYGTVISYYKSANTSKFYRQGNTFIILFEITLQILQTSDDALMTENGQNLLTEAGEYLKQEEIL
ncbi:MAG: hypothetical protein LBQ31_09250 [Bacteroidales bacterium]|jgi:hypothetical protein|nr:hypothetical protein [Bacteroidales bacterium]